MKFIITEGNLKGFIKKKLGVDLTGKIKLITSAYDIPIKFRNTIDVSDWKRLMNRYGPFFHIDAGHGREFLIQERGNDEFVGVDIHEQYVTGQEVLEYLRLDILGLGLNKIIDMYFDESEDLNESVNDVKRRFRHLDDLFTFATNVIYKGEKICDLYTGPDMLLDVIANYMVEKMYFEHFSDIDPFTQKWEEMVIFIEKYIGHKFSDSVKEHWERTCGNLNEGEITEKCWKGYTQKGMKTMFGKRYPNCVKKKKK